MSAIFWLSIVATFAQALVFLFGKARHKPVLAIAGTVGFVATAGIAVVQGIQDWDYAYLVPVSPIGNQILFVYRSTGNLQLVTVNKFDWQTGRPLPIEQPRLIRKGKESTPNVQLPIGDWGFDIDALGDCGKVLERIVIEPAPANGYPTVTFVRVKRKCTRVLICQTPPMKFVPPC